MNMHPPRTELFLCATYVHAHPSVFVVPVFASIFVKTDRHIRSFSQQHFMQTAVHNVAKTVLGARSAKKEGRVGGTFQGEVGGIREGPQHRRRQSSTRRRWGVHCRHPPSFPIQD